MRIVTHLVDTGQTTLYIALAERDSSAIETLLPITPALQPG